MTASDHRMEGSVLARSYELEVGPPALSWNDYSRAVQDEWNALLNSPEGGIEKNIQAFLEAHPCMVPGGQSMSGPSGHWAYPGALITQPRLPGFGGRVPDFLWMATDSLTLYAVLIEIEAPTKRWFTKAGVQTAEFTQAQNQLAEWKAWFSSPLNQAQFREAYCGSFSHPWRRLLPQYVLIFGRRSEFEGHDDLNRKRAFLQREGEYYMTFDRLHPIKDHDQYMTVRFDGTGYRAVSMPATLELSPAMANYRSAINSKEDVVDATPFLSAERKGFLKRRIAYWDEWQRRGGTGIRNMGDRE